MKMIFMGRKKQSAELLKWTAKQNIEIVAVCTDSQFENSPTAKTARAKDQKASDRRPELRLYQFPSGDPSGLERLRRLQYCHFE